MYAYTKITINLDFNVSKTCQTALENIILLKPNNITPIFLFLLTCITIKSKERNHHYRYFCRYEKIYTHTPIIATGKVTLLSSSFVFVSSNFTLPICLPPFVPIFVKNIHVSVCFRSVLLQQAMMGETTFEWFNMTYYLKLTRYGFSNMILHVNMKIKEP